MSIFLDAVLPNTLPTALAPVVKEIYPDDSYDLGSGLWLVADNTTAKAVSDRLGVTDGTHGSAIVVEAASYYGRANPAIWSWIKAKWETGPHG